VADAIARRLRKTLTDAEQALWRSLRDRQVEGCRFRRQVPIGRYIVDFACLDVGLIIEVDGGQHEINQADDAVRDAWLTKEGYRVLRFWNNDVLSNREGVLQKIAEALAIDV
jgi:very-short-patch-repair endonuclease